MSNDYPVEKIRHYNTEMLRNGFKTITEFAESIGKSNIQAASWLRDNSPRLIGNSLARDIEMSAGKGYGWLDKIHAPKRFEKWAIKDRSVTLTALIRDKAQEGKLAEEDLKKMEILMGLKSGVE